MTMKTLKALHRPVAALPADYTSTLTTNISDDGTSAAIYLYDIISAGGDWSGDSAAEFQATLSALPDTVTDVTLRINSPGGDVFEGIAIGNLIRASDLNVTAVVDGLAASIASVIAIACESVTMGAGSMMMVHDASGLCFGTAGDMRQLADLLDNIGGTIAGLYAAKAGGTSDAWLATMAAETWFQAAEAVEAGLADVVDGEAVDTSGAQDAVRDLPKMAAKYGWRNIPTPHAEAAPVDLVSTPDPAVDDAELAASTVATHKAERRFDKERQVRYAARHAAA